MAKWSAKFLEPVPAPGRTLNTLSDARDYILSLPDDEQQKEHWQAATEALLHAAKHGGPWLFLARIGMMTALDGGPAGRTEPTGRKSKRWRR